MVTLSLGLIGLGGVGSAVVEACGRGERAMAQRGYRVSLDACLVRDRRRPRPVHPPRLTDDPERFFSRRYNVVVETTGGVEPARSLALRAMRNGAAFVTANKALVAAAGGDLRQAARAAGVSLRIDACALAGVPFIGALERRPLFGGAARFQGLLNGTSNFILTRMAKDGLSADDALARAQALGYAEPDPSRDLNGLDAADKLVVLLQACGIAGATPERFARKDVRLVRRVDIEAATSLGGAIKAVAAAERRGSTVSGFVGPTFVPVLNRLAHVHDELNAIAIDGPFVRELFFCGVGAGPAATAATLLDDAIEAASGPDGAGRAEVGLLPARLVPPEPSWFARLEFDRGRPGDSALTRALATRGLPVRRGIRADGSWHGLVGPCDEARAIAALTAVAAVHGATWNALYALEG
ncbi:MAG: homoserine dehydrogenase [Acidobacteriota bacterium]